jgi:hypothetical protein
MKDVLKEDGKISLNLNSQVICLVVDYECDCSGPNAHLMHVYRVDVRNVPYSCNPFFHLSRHSSYAVYKTSLRKERIDKSVTSGHTSICNSVCISTLILGFQLLHSTSGILYRNICNATEHLILFSQSGQYNRKF